MTSCAGECDVPEECCIADDQPRLQFSRFRLTEHTAPKPMSRTAVTIIACIAAMLLISLVLAAALTSGLGGATSVRGGASKHRL